MQQIKQQGSGSTDLPTKELLLETIQKKTRNTVTKETNLGSNITIVNHGHGANPVSGNFNLGGTDFFALSSELGLALLT